MTPEQRVAAWRAAHPELLPPSTMRNPGPWDATPAQKCVRVLQHCGDLVAAAIKAQR